MHCDTQELATYPRLRTDRSRKALYTSPAMDHDTHVHLSHPSTQMPGHSSGVAQTSVQAFALSGPLKQRCVTRRNCRHVTPVFQFVSNSPGDTTSLSEEKGRMSKTRGPCLYVPSPRSIDTCLGIPLLTHERTARAMIT